MKVILICLSSLFALSAQWAAYGQDVQSASLSDEISYCVLSGNRGFSDNSDAGYYDVCVPFDKIAYTDASGHRIEVICVYAKSQVAADSNQPKRVTGIAHPSKMEAIIDSPEHFTVAPTDQFADKRFDCVTKKFDPAAARATTTTAPDTAHMTDAEREGLGLAVP